MADDPSLGRVFLLALGTALATGLGALPFLFLRSLPRRWLGLANAGAAGLMLAASFSLIYEGYIQDWRLSSLGVFLGLVFIVLSRRVLSGHEPDEDGAGNPALALASARGADVRKMMLIVGVMTLHSAAEGIGVGVAFGKGQAFGGLIAASIALHNIPEGLAISLVLVPRGVSVAKAVLWSVFSSLPQPLMAVPAFLFVEHFHPFLPAGLGMAAGAMVWMCVAELLPEAFEDAGGHEVAVTVTLAVVLLMVFQGLLAT